MTFWTFYMDILFPASFFFQHFYFCFSGFLSSCFHLQSKEFLIYRIFFLFSSWCVLYSFIYFLSVFWVFPLGHPPYWALEILSSKKLDTVMPLWRTCNLVGKIDTEHVITNMTRYKRENKGFKEECVAEQSNLIYVSTLSGLLGLVLLWGNLSAFTLIHPAGSYDVSYLSLSYVTLLSQDLITLWYLQTLIFFVTFRAFLLVNPASSILSQWRDLEDVGREAYGLLSIGSQALLSNKPC